jgi:hypothetical protein
LIIAKSQLVALQVDEFMAFFLEFLKRCTPSAFTNTPPYVQELSSFCMAQPA